LDLAITKPIEYLSQRVITFDLIDKLHERVKGTASRNFHENKHRFTPGEDYHIVPASQKDDFRSLGISIPNRGLTVLTESGYLVLVKSFTDERAWAIQKTLVKSYFRAKEILDPKGELAKMFRSNTALMSTMLERKSAEIEQIGKDLTVFKGAAQTLEKIESTVVDIRSRLPRREFSAKTKRLFREVSLIKFGGHCLIYPRIRIVAIETASRCRDGGPAGQGLRIVDRAGNITEDGEYDHFFNHSENGQDQGWIISKKANRAMKDNRQKYRPEFEIFQRNLNSCLNEKRMSATERLARLDVKRTTPGKQTRLF